MRAVVIGSGLGGLTSALLLQQRGYQVTVVEQHTRPGGMLHRFFREGLPYDTGFHYCGSIEAGQPLGQIFRHLGVFDELEFHALNEDGFDRLHFPDLIFEIPKGWEAYRERLKATFPHESTGIDAIIDEMLGAVSAYSLYKMQPGLDPSALLHAEERYLVDICRENVRDPRVLAVLAGQSGLYGVPPAEASLGVHSLIMDHFVRGAYSVRGGGDKIAMTLTRKIRAGGGKVRLKTEAVRIHTEGRQATGVELLSGELLPADLVISNLHPRLTLEMLPTSATRKAYRSRVLDAELGYGHMGAYLEVDGPVPELGNRNLYRHLSWDVDRGYRSIAPNDIGMYFASSPTEHVPNDSGRGVILMIIPLDYDSVCEWSGSLPKQRPAAYDAFKSALLDKAIDTLLADHPTLAGRIVRSEASTPLTTQYFTRSPNGATYGQKHSLAQMGRYRPSQRTRVRNLMLVGQGVFSPGVLGVSLSAYYAIGQLFGMEELLQELRQS